MKPFINGVFHAWESNGRILVSNEQTKALRDFADVDAAVNALYLEGNKEAARALNNHVRAPVLALCAALRGMADGYTISADDYSAAREHPAATGNDRDALLRLMYGSPLRGDRDRVRDLATEIKAWKPKAAPVVVVLKRMRREVPAPRNGKPGYRWAAGYIVNGEYPPVGRNEAYSRAREIGGPKVKVKIED